MSRMRRSSSTTRIWAAAYRASAHGTLRRGALIQASAASRFSGLINLQQHVAVVRPSPCPVSPRLGGSGCICGAISLLPQVSPFSGAGTAGAGAGLPRLPSGRRSPCPDQVLQHTAQRLLGDAQNVEKLRHRHAGVAANEMQNPVMRPAKAKLLQNAHPDRPRNRDRRRTAVPPSDGIRRRSRCGFQKLCQPC